LGAFLVWLEKKTFLLFFGENHPEKFLDTPKLKMCVACAGEVMAHRRGGSTGLYGLRFVGLAVLSGLVRALRAMWG